MAALAVRTYKKDEVIDLTEDIEEMVEEDAGEEYGLVHIFSAHTTCALTTADLDQYQDPDQQLSKRTSCGH